MQKIDSKKMKKKFKLLSLSKTLTDGANCLLLSIIPLVFASIFWFLSLPHKRELDRLEADLQASLARLDHAESTKNDLDVLFRCIKEDPEFLEVQARDRVPWYKRNEIIFTIER